MMARSPDVCTPNPSTFTEPLCCFKAAHETRTHHACNLGLLISPFTSSPSPIPNSPESPHPQTNNVLPGLTFSFGFGISKIESFIFLSRTPFGATTLLLRDDMALLRLRVGRVEAELRTTWSRLGPAEAAGAASLFRGRPRPLLVTGSMGTVSFSSLRARFLLELAEVVAAADARGFLGGMVMGVEG